MHFLRIGIPLSKSSFDRCSLVHELTVRLHTCILASPVYLPLSNLTFMHRMTISEKISLIALKTPPILMATNLDDVMNYNTVANS